MSGPANTYNGTQVLLIRPTGPNTLSMLPCIIIFLQCFWTWLWFVQEENLCKYFLINFECFWEILYLFRMFKLSKKMNQALEAGSFFSTNEWTFGSSSYQSLIEAVSHAEDCEEFPVDLTLGQGFDWDHYVGDYLKGVRQFILKDEMTSLPAARKKLNRFLDIIELPLLWKLRLSLLQALLVLQTPQNDALYVCDGSSQTDSIQVWQRNRNARVYTVNLEIQYKLLLFLVTEYMG